MMRRVPSIPTQWLFPRIGPVRGGGDGPAPPDPEIPLAELFFLNSVTLTPDVTVTFWDAQTGGNQINAPVVYDILGVPSVIQQANTWARFTPQSVGEADGTMVNPHRVAIGSDAQGFNRLMETSATIKPTIRVRYVPALNVEVMDGPSLPLTAGRTYVKHVPNAGYGDAGNAKDYALLTVLPAQPPEGFFRPATSLSDKSILARGAAVDYSVFRELADVANQISLTTALSYIPKFRFGNGFGGEILRSLSNDRAGMASTYMSTSGINAVQAYLRAHIGGNSDTNKQALLNRLIQIGLDRYCDYLGGWRGGSGAGQFQKELECMVMAGFALKSTAILEAAKEINQNVVGQVKWVPPTALNYKPGWPTGGDIGSNQRRWNASFKDIHIGQPFLFQGNAVQSALSCMSVLQRYLTTSSPTAIQGLFSILLLQNGPGGITGLDWWLTAKGGNGAKDATNDRAAAVMWLDRYMQGRSDADIKKWARNFYAAYRGLVDMPVYSGPGITFETDRVANESVLTSTASGFDFNWTDCNWSTGTMNAVETRYSQDGVSFVTANASAVTGSVTEVATGVPLAIQKHYVQMRYKNLAPNGNEYWSEFSPNFSYCDESTFRGERLMITPTGGRTAHAPVFLVQPSMFKPVNQGTEEPAFAPISGTLLLTDAVLVAGIGYVDAHPAATIEYQLLVNGVPSGARQSSNRFVRPRTVPGGVDVAIRVFANNGVEIFADTNAIQFQTIIPDPADIVVRSAFDAEFEPRWPEVLESITSVSTSNADNEWSPFLDIRIEPPGDLEITSTDIPQTTSGAIRGLKSAGNPWMQVNLAASRPLVAGMMYRLEADFAIGVPDDAAVPLIVRLGHNPLPSIETTGAFSTTRVDQFPSPKIHKFVKEFTAAGANLYLALGYGTSSGGTVGGDPTLTNILVREVSAFEGEGYPEPLPSPVTILDTNVDGFNLVDWIIANNVTYDGTGLLLGSGAGNPSATLNLTEQFEVGRQYRVTTTVVRIGGTAQCRYNIGRPQFTDPDYGVVPQSNGLYINDTARSTSVATVVDVLRLETTPALRFNLNVRDSVTTWRLNRLLVEAL